MGPRTAEVVLIVTFGLLAALAAVRYHDLWGLIRRARGGTRRLLVTFALLVVTLAVTMGLWAVGLALWPAPRADSVRIVLYAILWSEHIFMVLLVHDLYERMTHNGH